MSGPTAMLVALALAAPQGSQGKPHKVELRVGDVFRPGDESHWTVDAEGKPIGEVWSIYAGLVDWPGAAAGTMKAHRFLGGVRLKQTIALGEIEALRTGDLLTDDLGRPLRFVERLKTGEVYGSVEVAIAEGKASCHVVNGSVGKDVEVAIPPDVFLLANNFVSHLELLAALHPPKEGAPTKAPVFSPDVLQLVPFELRHQGPFTSKWNDDAVEGEVFRDSLGEVLKVMGDGKLLELDLSAAGIQFRRVDAPSPKLEIEPQKAAAKAFDSEPVVVENGEVRIAGTITKPKGASKPRPAIFFVSGSGAQDRDGTGGGVDLGTHEILDRLTEAGFLVLRVDDRGAGATTGPAGDVSYDDLVGDARACVDFLMKRSDVDRERVAVIGHSEGGETAPILACERPLAAIVLMAAPGRDLKAILREQKRRALEELHIPEADVEAELAVHAKFLDLACGVGPIDPKEVRADYAPFLKNRRWFQSHFRHDCITQIRKVKCPVLIAQGGKDMQVSPELDAPALKRALDEEKHGDATLRLFPDLDHLFKRCTTTPPSFADYLKARPVDPEFLDVLTAWLTTRLKP
jgi:pimeloyl-ACP methyl ester carboxylesterase